MIGKQYELKLFLRPGTADKELHKAAADVSQVVEKHNGSVLNVEHRQLTLKYKIKDCLSCICLLLVPCIEPAVAQKILQEVRYKIRPLRVMIIKKPTIELSAFEDMEIKDRVSIRCLNPSLSNCLGAANKILPSRLTKLSPKKQRALSRAIKTARALGVLPL